MISPWPLTTLAAVTAAVLCALAARRRVWIACPTCTWVPMPTIPYHLSRTDPRYIDAQQQANTWSSRMAEWHLACPLCHGAHGISVRDPDAAPWWHLAGALAVLVAAVAGYGWIAGRG